MLKLFLLPLLCVGKTQIVEINLNGTFVTEHGLMGTERVAATWKTILSNSGVDVQVFVLQKGRLAIVLNELKEVDRVKDFIASQDPWVEKLNLSSVFSS
jgi:hypothetical protein